MKKALVEPSGRVAQVEPVNPDPKSDGIPFPVAPPLAWHDCDDDVTPQSHSFDGSTFVLIPVAVQAQPDNAGAFVSRQRDAALDALDAAISVLPTSQQNAFRLIQQLLKD